PFREHRSMWHELLIGYAHGGYHNSTLMPEDYAAMEAKLDELSMRIENTAQGAAVCLLDTGDEDFLFNPLEFDRTEWVNVNGQWRRTKVPALGMAKISDTVQNYGAGSIQEDSISGNGQSDVLSWEGFRKGCRLSLAVERGEVALLTANFTSREELNPTVKRAEASPVPGGDVRSLHFACEQTKAKVTMSCFPEEPFIRVRTHLKTSLENARFLLQVSIPWGKPTIIADEPFLVRERDPLGEPQVDLMRSRPVGMFESPEESSSDVSEGENRGVFYGHTFAAAEGPEGGIALVNRGTPGYQFTGRELGNILLSVRTPKSLDQYRRCSHLLPPHECVFKHLLFFYSPRERNAVYRLARAFNFPLLHLKGERMPEPRLVSGLPPNIYLSAAYWDEGVVLRFFEMEGKVTECELTLPCPREFVLEECNLLLRPMPGSTAVAGQQGRVQLAFSPYEIKTVRLRCSA
ncbi:MAG: hypothetical protein KAT86_08545, partial [Candidatus Latescibacteria bacterium]|nr:hypothetical protein [Candidatus Latescibacterota bacterium]